MKQTRINIATEEDLKSAKTITGKMEAVDIIERCGISETSAAFIIEKIKAGKAVIAVTEDYILLGFFRNVVRENGEIGHAYKVYRIANPGNKDY